MMSIFEDEYDIDNDEIQELPELRSLHAELINEEISEQVEDPFVSKVNFLDDYFDEYDDLMEQYDENPDMVAKLVDDATAFCNEVLKLIDEKYNLDLDDDALAEYGIEKLKAVTYSLYDFFIINYTKNLKKFFVKYIIKNAEEICNVLNDVRDKTDVTTVSFKQKLNNEHVAVILSNLRTVIEYVNSLDLEPLEVMDIYNPERYDVYQISTMITDGVLNGDFVSKFFEPIIVQDTSEDYIEIFSSIEGNLLKKFKKVQADVKPYHPEEEDE